MAADFPLNFRGCRVQSAGGDCDGGRVEEGREGREVREGRQAGSRVGSRRTRSLVGPYS